MSCCVPLERRDRRRRRRTSGGRPSFRWTSEAPVWTASASSGVEIHPDVCRHTPGCFRAAGGKAALQRPSTASARSGTRAIPRCSPGCASSPWRSRSTLRQRSCAARDAPRGPRPAIERMLQLPRGAVERRERRVDGDLVRLERARRDPRAGRGSRLRRAARRRSTRTSRRPRPDRSARRRRRRAARGSRAIARPRPPQRQPVSAEALELPRPRARAPRRRVAGARESAGLRSARRRRRRWRGRPWETPSRSRPECRRARRPPAARNVRARAPCTERCPRTRRRGRSRPRARLPAPVIPFAPSAPTIASACTRSPLPSNTLLLDSIWTSSPRAPPTPALARCVEQERVEPPPLRHPEQPARGRDERPRRRSGSGARPCRPAPRPPATGRPGTAARRAASARRRTACRAETVPCRRAAPTLLPPRGGRQSSTRRAHRRRRPRRTASRA